jgi:hypothetical protein
MSENFADLSMAARMREVISGIVRDELDKARVLPRYGKVNSVDRSNKTAMVLFDGDTFPVKVRVPEYLQTATDTIDYANQPIVKVEGSGTNTWVTEILYGSNYQAKSRLFQPTIVGTDGEKQAVTHFAGRTSGIPAIGGVWILGSWANTGNATAVDRCFFELTVRRVSTAAQVSKKYILGVSTNDLVGQWFKLIPNYTEGAHNTEYFDVDVYGDAGILSFLVRKTAGGVANGWYEYDLVIHGEGYEQTAAADAAATTMYDPTYSVDSILNPAFTAGSGLAPEQAIGYRAQSVISGGGIRGWDGTSVSWGTRFIAMGIGKSSIVRSGYWDINPPTATTLIPVYNKLGATTVTLGTGSVPMAAWDTLYWEPPLWTTNTSNDGLLHIVNYTSTGYPFMVPSTWVKICQINGDDNSCTWFDGEKTTPWTAFSYGTNVVEYSAASFPARYRKHNGRIELRGLVKANAALAAGATLVTMPAGFRPTNALLEKAMIGPGNTMTRLDIFSTGIISTPVALAINTWVSLDGITYAPEA